MSGGIVPPRQTIFRDGGLVALFVVTLAYLGVVFLLPGNPAQLPLGVLELFFAPGYALGAILFVRRPLLPLPAEFGVAVGLSIVFNGLVGLALVVSGQGLPVTWLAAADASAVSLGAVVHALWGDSPFATDAWGAVRRELRLPGLRPSYRKPVGGILVAIVVAFAGVIYLGTTQPTPSTPSSLGLYGSSGTTASLPTNLTVGQVGLVELAVTDGYSSGPVQLQVTAMPWNRSTNLTTEPWVQPLSLRPGSSSTLPLSLAYRDQTTLSVTFEFLEPNHYALAFSLRTMGDTVLVQATLGVAVGT